MAKLAFNRQTALKVGATAAFLGCLYWGQNLVGVDQFAMKVSVGKVDPQFQDGGFRAFVPFVQYVHSYNVNTQRVEFNAGSCRFFPGCNNTEDHNPLLAHVGIDYKVQRDVPKLSLHRWSMDGWILPDGYWLLTEIANESANAVMGRKGIAETMQKPEQFLKDFQDDLVDRLGRNNVPIEIQNIDLKGLKTRFPTSMPLNTILTTNAPR